MKNLLSALLIAGSLLGCASQPSALRQDQGYVLEWIGERPLMD